MSQGKGKGEARDGEGGNWGERKRRRCSDLEHDLGEEQGEDADRGRRDWMAEWEA